MKKLFILSVALVVVFTSCKKKDKTPDPTPTTTTGSPAPPSTDFYGWLRVYNEYQFTLWNFQETPMNSFARTYFATAMVNDATASPTFQYGGLVTANNNLDTLQYITGSYEKNIGAQFYSTPVTWKVAGGGTIPTFTASCNVPFPACLGYTTFPTTLSKSVGVTYTITNFTNTDRIIVSLSDGNGQFIFQHNATISNGIATVNFPGSETANFANGTNGFIFVYLYNDELQTLGGKQFRFSNVKQNFINGFTIVN